MAISQNLFEELRDTVGKHASWAIWSPAGEKPKSNVGDLSVFSDPMKLRQTLEKLNPSIVLAGLNASEDFNAGDFEPRPFSNFHSDSSLAQDFKIRYATVGTALEGAYMTDVLKDYIEKKSDVVGRELANDRTLEQQKVEGFFKEIIVLSPNPQIFAFGDMAFKLIKKYNNCGLRVYKLPHYAHFQSKETFREKVIKVLEAAMHAT